MKLSIGSTVRTPKGRKATVRSFDQVMTGRRGRPAHLVTVQERDRSGHFVQGTTTYRPSELQPA